MLNPLNIHNNVPTLLLCLYLNTQFFLTQGFSILTALLIPWEALSLVSKFHFALLCLTVEGGTYVLQDASHSDGKDWLPTGVIIKTFSSGNQISVSGTPKLMQTDEASKPLPF